MTLRLLVCCLLTHGVCCGELPLPFERYGPAGTFLSRAAGFSLMVNREEAVFVLAHAPSIRMRLAGANPRAQAQAEGLLASRANYLIGSDPAGWRIDVAQFGRIRVREVLPGIDIVYYGNHKRLEYDLVLRAGADPASIRLRFDGANPAVNPAGDLVLKTQAGEMVEHRPQILQEGTHVEGSYRIEANGDVCFELGPFDHTRELRIDPVISYLTYLGGTSDDSPNAIAVDAAGSAYIAGSTSSFTFPVTTGALQTVYPPTSETVAFVTKLNAAGTGLVYTTYLGGSGINGGDAANSIAVDASGNVYVTGTTGSANFPVTSGSLSTSLSGATDAFVSKINPTGTALVYSTYLGGSGQESAYGIAVDASGNAYVAGSTSSTNFPVTTGAPQSALKSANDAFVAKLNPLGKTLTYATYLGGSAEDDAYAIAVDSSGNAYVTGSTASTDFPVTSAAFQKTIGPAAVAFAVKVSAAGTSLTYATFLGGTGGDSGNAIALDGSGNAYVAGTTASADFPVTAGVTGGAAPGIASYGHAFVTKVNPTGAGLVYSTFLGGSSADGANGLALDASLDAIVTGFTYSPNFPVTANPADPVANFNPAAFLAKINPAATAVSYSTLLGASGSTVAQAVAMDSSSHAYVAGYTGSLTLPASPGAFQTYNATVSPQASTGFVAKVDLGSAVSCALSFSPTSLSLPVSGGSAAASVTAPAGCAWEAIPSATWLTVSSPTSLVGPGMVSVIAGSNTMNLSGRSATVSAGSAGLTVTQLAGSCSSPQFYPATQTFAPAGGLGSVAVAIPASCPVTATATASWIVVNSGASATGDDLVTFTVAANSGGPRSGTITIAGASYSISQSSTSVPAVVSVTPNNASGTAQVLSAFFSDTAGAAYLNDRTLLINSVINGAGACMVQVVPGGTYLLNDSGSSFLGPLTASGTLANSQCTLNGAGSGVSNSGNTSTVVLSISFSASFTGAKNIYVNAGDIFGSHTGYLLEGTYTISGGVLSASVSPSNGSGSSQVFTAVFSDASGAAYLNDRTVLINSVLNGGGACFIQVVPGGTYLANDAGTAFLGPLTASGTLSNSQCTLNGSGSSVINSGNNSTVVLSISFNAGFAGARNVYMNTGDIYVNHSGYQLEGTYTVAGGALTTGTVAPSAGSGSSQVFTAIFSDTAGAAYLNDRTFLINSVLNGGGGCFVQAVPGGTYLLNDAGSSFLGPLTSSGTLVNSQCTLNGTGSSAVNSGNSSTITLSLSFSAGFGGAKNIYMNTGDIYGNHTGYQLKGTYTVTGGILTTDSVAPSSGSGLSQVFTAVFSDTAGAAFLNDRTFLINSVLNGSGACFVQLVPGGGYLLNDAGTSFSGPLMPSGTLSNSQCTVNATGSSVANSGNSSTVTLSISFNANFAGAKNIYMNTGDIFGNHSGYLLKGTFTVP